MRINTYKDIETFLFSQLPMFQRIGPKAFKKDLGNIIKLDTFLGEPHREFKSIHIAGTNGKGSTAFFTATALAEAGFKVGLYTSPHYKDYRERIRVNGELVSKEFVVDFVNRLIDAGWFEQDEKPSFFEITVAMAFEYFKQEKVDYAVIETGLGGRLDSTNIIRPQVCAITNIDLDHTAFLGNTIPLIAREKAGIIKEKVPVVIGRYQEDSWDIFKEVTAEKDASIIRGWESAGQIPDRILAEFPDYQKENMATALGILQSLKVDAGQPLLEKAWLVRLKEWSYTGRYKVLGTKPKVVADSAHNMGGIRLLLDQISKETFKDLHIVLAMVNDKDIGEILKALPASALYYFSEASIPRALAAEELQTQAAATGLRGKVYSTVSEALDAAKRQASEQDLVLVTGSIFTVAEVV